jgi:SAM-dependent methyltransferase
MNPATIGARYDAIAHLWQRDTPDTYGIAALERALRFCTRSGVALDVGCGSQGRFLDRLRTHGFRTEGLDISPVMITLAKERSPDTLFHTADICEWEPAGAYDFISAWDSTFHLPLASQAPVLAKLGRALRHQGVLLFTCGGGPAGEIVGTFHGQEFGYSTLGVNEFVLVLETAGLECVHVEYDQPPEKHVYIVAVKT